MYSAATAPILKIYLLNKIVAELYCMGMEDETREFLVKIANTIAIVLLWMMLNVFFGIYKELGIIQGAFTWKNGLYYLLAIATLVLLILHIKRKWNL